MNYRRFVIPTPGGTELLGLTSAFVAEGSDVFTVPKWSVDRLLVKVDDIKKK